jgi:hypothetical protein
MVDFFKHVAENITSAILLNYILVPLIMTTALGAILKGVFNRLKEKKEIYIFSASSFVLFMALIYGVGTPSAKPQLDGAIQSVLAGNVGSDRDTVVAFQANIINTGTMQTIVKNWRVSVRANGHDYQAVFPQMPDSFTFNNIPNISPNQPTSITYHKSDSLLDKSLTPIQSGSMLTGILFAAFQNVDSSVFKAGAEYSIIYEDVFSRSYTMQISTNGSMSIIGIAPGIKAEMACQMPHGGLPKLGNDITSSISPNASPLPATKLLTSP